MLLRGNPLRAIEHSLDIVGVVNDGRLITEAEIAELKESDDASPQG